MKMTLDEAYDNWEALGSIPTSDLGLIESPFLHFPENTQREEIWLWLESQNPEFSAHEAMYGASNQRNYTLASEGHTPESPEPNDEVSHEQPARRERMK